MICDIGEAYKIFKKNWKDLKWWRHLYGDLVFSRFLENRGIFIIDEDWDNLIILDACRYDVFREVLAKEVVISGKLEFKISRGSCTRDFLLENFRHYPNKQKLKEIVYVAANPFVDRYLPSDLFYKIYSTWIDGWDEDLATVPPISVMRDALRASYENPQKRLIIHFVQPHAPFLESGLPFNPLQDCPSARKLGEVKFNDGGGREKNVLQPWDLIEVGAVEKERILEAYKETLKKVLVVVKKITEILPGQTIITSDHGELAGEKNPHPLYPFKEYGHPCGLINIEELVKVPWLIIENKK